MEPFDTPPSQPPTPATDPWFAGPPPVAPPTSAWPGLQAPQSPPPPPPDLPPAASSMPTTPPPGVKWRRRVAGFGIGALLVGVGGVAGGFVGGKVASTTVAARSSSKIETVSVRTTGDTTSSINAASVLKSLSNSVVAIQANVTIENGPWSSQGTDAGTGIVINRDGYILTNAHVIADAGSIEVSLPGSAASRTASVVGSDAQRDLALIHVDDATGLVPAPLADRDNAQVGEAVVAIGNALDLEGSFTVTQGIVSALDRSIQTSESSLNGLLQTDAAISSGNSGGPLADANGTVIGINTAVASSSDQVQASNIGFAIPIRSAIDFVSTWLPSRR